MKSPYILLLSLIACTLAAAEEPDQYRLTLAPQSAPKIPTVEPRLAAVDQKSTSVKESLSKRMILSMRVVSYTQQLNKQFELLRPQPRGKKWESLNPEQRASASSAAALAEKLQKELTALRGEVDSFPDPSVVIEYIINAEITLTSYNDFFSSLLHRK